MKMKVLADRSCLTLTPWTVACQGSLSVEFSRQEYWEQFAISFSRGSSQPRDQTWSPALQTDSLLSEPPGKPVYQTIWKRFLPASRLPFYWWFPLMCRSLCIWASPTIFAFVTFLVGFKKFFAKIDVKELTSSRSFRISDVMFKSVIHFELKLIFVLG